MPYLLATTPFFFSLDVVEDIRTVGRIVGLGLNLGLPDCSLPSETGQVTLGPWMLGWGCWYCGRAYGGI